MRIPPGTLTRVLRKPGFRERTEVVYLRGDTELRIVLERDTARPRPGLKGMVRDL